MDQGWAVAVEFTDDPHPRNVLWEMWGLPMFDIADARPGHAGGHACRAAYPDHYIRVTAYDASLGRQTTALSFIVNRPGPTSRASGWTGRRPRTARIHYSLHPYAADRPRGSVMPQGVFRTERGAAKADGHAKPGPRRAASPCPRPAQAPRPRQPRSRPEVNGAAGPAPLPPDATVELGAEQQALRISAMLDRLDREFIGLAPVKDRVREIAALLLVDRLRQRYGLVVVAAQPAHVLHRQPGNREDHAWPRRWVRCWRELGYLRKGQLVSVTRDDLVGQYVGHTAPKTKEVLKRAMGGVLLIDEAYYLYRPENERDYGQEAIEILLQFMEAHREDLVVILAGYADRMDVFFRSNPGMASRVAHHIDFPDFTHGELMQIAGLMLDREQYRLSPAAQGRPSPST